MLSDNRQFFMEHLCIIYLHSYSDGDLMYIYIDILLITNIYTNFFLLKTTARLVHSPLRNTKSILAALAGSLFSLIILLPPLNTALLLFIRIISAAIMIIIAFSGKSFRETYHIGLIFFFVSFIFAGIEYGITVLFQSSNMLWHNSTLYVNISMLTLVVSTIISYAAICFFRRFIDSSNTDDCKYKIIITHNGKTVSIDGIGDTCNNLTDIFTGKPVIICGSNSILQLLDKTEAEFIMQDNIQDYIEGWRIIPFSTIHSDGMLPIFKPSGTIIKCTEKNIIKSADVYIGIVSKNMDAAVFNPKIL